MQEERLPGKTTPPDMFRILVIVGLVSPVAFLLYESLSSQLAVPLFAATWGFGFVSDIVTTRRFFALEPENFGIRERNRVFPKLVRRLGFTRAIPVFILAVELPLAAVATLALTPSYLSVTHGITAGLGETLSGFWAVALMLGVIHFDAALRNYSIERKKMDNDALA